ncbi:MAG: GNAT family N-acetyltransferase [Arenicella sp.]
MQVNLVDVVRENFNDVIELELEKSQQQFLPSNLLSIAESRFSPACYLRAICLGDTVVGFLEYEFGEGEQDKDDCTIWRFMIDRKHQNTGIGKTALGILLEEIKSYERCRYVDVYYSPKNRIAKKLYAAYGFKEVGDRDDGTVIAVVVL